MATPDFRSISAANNVSVLRHRHARVIRPETMKHFVDGQAVPKPGA
jgi:hypothetical protein